MLTVLAVQRGGAFLVAVDRTRSHFVPKIFKAQNRPFGVPVTVAGASFAAIDELVHNPRDQMSRERIGALPPGRAVGQWRRRRRRRIDYLLLLVVVLLPPLLFLLFLVPTVRSRGGCGAIGRREVRLHRSGGRIVRRYAVVEEARPLRSGGRA